VNGVSEDVAFTTTGADLSYRHLHAFRVPRLVFTSELRFVNDELAQALRVDTVNTERHDRSWVNRFDYTIGRLELSARLALSEYDGRSHQLLYFMVRRHFGAVL
jgi:hypothetical protein